MSQSFFTPQALEWDEAKSKLRLLWQAMMCRSNVHYWSKWSAVVECKTGVTPRGFNDIQFFQARACRRCRESQTRGWTLNDSIRKPPKRER